MIIKRKTINTFLYLEIILLQALQACQFFLQAVSQHCENHILALSLLPYKKMIEMKKSEEIQVKTLEGEPAELLSKYADNPLLVLFFNIRCLGCVGRAIPLAYDFSQEYENLQVVAIHTNFGKEIVSKEDILNIFTSKELPIPIYFDNKQENYEKFACEGTPHWLMFDKEGELFRSFYGSQDGAQNRLLYAIDELVNL